MSDALPLLFQHVDIPGSGNVYRLSIGKEQETDAAETEYDQPPLWKDLIDDCIDFCKHENICLSYLAEQGGIRRGDSTNYRFWFPDDIKIYIANQIFKTS